MKDCFQDEATAFNKGISLFNKLENSINQIWVSSSLRDNIRRFESGSCVLLLRFIQKCHIFLPKSKLLFKLGDHLLRFEVFVVFKELFDFFEKFLCQVLLF